MESSEKGLDGDGPAVGPQAKREKLEKLDVLIEKDNNPENPRVVLKRLDKTELSDDQVIQDMFQMTESTNQDLVEVVQRRKLTGLASSELGSIEFRFLGTLVPHKKLDFENHG